MAARCTLRVCEVDEVGDERQQPARHLQPTVQQPPRPSVWKSPVQLWSVIRHVSCHAHRDEQDEGEHHQRPMQRYENVGAIFSKARDEQNRYEEDRDGYRKAAGKVMSKRQHPRSARA
jgi:hypothetical protein